MPAPTKPNPSLRRCATLGLASPVEPWAEALSPLRRHNGETIAAAATLAILLESRDPATDEHSRRVAELAEGIALSIGLSYELAQAVHLAGALHDLGKIALPDSILRSTGELSAREWAIVHRHPTIGADLLSHIGELAMLAPVVASHHERYDGAGYPQGLRGEEIPLEARIIAVADAYDAMTSDRPYRQALSIEDAREELREGSGTQFDPDVVEAFERYLDALIEAVAVG